MAFPSLLPAWHPAPPCAFPAASGAAECLPTALPGLTAPPRCFPAPGTLTSTNPAPAVLSLQHGLRVAPGGLPRGGCAPCPGRDGCCLPWAACLGWEGKELGMSAGWMARGGGMAAGRKKGELLGVVERGRSCARSCSCCPEAHGGRILPSSAAGHPQAWMKACSLPGEGQQ